MPPREFIQNAVREYDRGPCWLDWPYAFNEEGRPIAWIREQCGTRNAVRLAWLLANGKLPPRQLNHERWCDDARCWNPSHCYDGTQPLNIADAIATGKHVAPRGEAQGLSRLTEAQVLEVYQRCQTLETYPAIAAAYGIRPATVVSIAKGRSWGWLTGAVRGGGTRDQSAVMRTVHASRLTHEQVLEIYRRRQAGETCPAIAADYDVSPTTVSQIGTGRKWAWLTGA
jgi:hypothetical protein